MSTIQASRVKKKYLFIGGIPRDEHVRLHQKLRKFYGSASKCENEDCQIKSPKRFEWALRKGHIYSDKAEDYIQLCCSCHRKYDMKEDFPELMRSLNIGNISRRMRPVCRTNISTGITDEYKSVWHAHVATGMSRNTIHKSIRGINSKKSNLRWKYKN